MNGRSDVLVFEVDALQCAVDASTVVEVLRATAITRFAGHPPFIAGVVDVRGRVVPVLDLRARFGEVSRPVALSDRFIVAEAGGCTVALWVDRVLDVVPFDTASFVATEGLVVGTRSLAGVMRLPQGLVMIHDLSAFLTESEIEALLAAGAAG